MQIKKNNNDKKDRDREKDIDIKKRWREIEWMSEFQVRDGEFDKQHTHMMKLHAA